MQSDELYNQLKVLTEELIGNVAFIKLQVGGYSMFPFLKNGDIVTIKKCGIDEFKIGNVIVFKNGNKLIAHRLIKFAKVNNKKCFILKGDSCSKKDKIITEDFVVGKVVSFFKKGKEKSFENNYYKTLGLFIARFSRILTPFIIFQLWVTLKLKKNVSVIKSVINSIGFISRSSTKLAYINAFISMFRGILPLIIIYLVKWLIDVISNINNYSDKTEIYKIISLIISLTALAFLLQSILSVIGSQKRELLSQSISQYIYGLLHKKHSLLDMEYLEDSNQQDKIHRAVQEAGFRPLKMTNEWMAFIQSFASWLLIAIMLFTVHWGVFILILIAALPEFWVKIKFSIKLHDLNKKNSQKEREAYYYNRILTDLTFAKELRLFNLANFFTERFRNIQNNLHLQKNKILNKRVVADILAQSFAVILLLFSFGFVSYLAVKGKVSIGSVVLFFLLFQRGFSVIKELFQSIAGLIEDNVFLNNFFDFMNLASVNKIKQISKPINTLKKGIFIENISFQYPSSNRKSLTSVSIEIPKGKTIALVGPNGSGKSTLVKLLCGFYKPSSGRILFDDNDISLIPPDDLRKHITTVFQDFALFNLTAEENIFLGNIAKPVNGSLIMQAAKNADIALTIENLPSAYKTMLGNLFEKGEELSIGQWQKLAIAKAFYRDAPILLMDEPSSALDAETELNLLQNLKNLAKDKTVLIISHRFSTIEWADIIYVIDDGNIIEKGSHHELMELKGKYFKMFEQAER